MVPGTRTRGSQHKLELRRIPLNIGKDFFLVRVMEQWVRSPGEAVGSSSLQIFGSPRDEGLGTLLRVALLGQGRSRGTRGPCAPPLGLCDTELRLLVIRC